MFCNNCGKEVDEKAIVCIHCGVELKKKEPVEDYNQSKKGIGILLSLLLGLFGLLIGVILYPAGTVARKTFFKGWLVTFIVYICVSIVVYIIVFITFVSIYGYFL